MKIVIGTGPDDEVVAAWREEFPDVEFVPASTDEEQLLEVEDADGYIGRISRDAFRAAGPRLRWVHSTGAGIETLAAIPELVESDVTVTNTRGGHAATIAEHTFGLLLTLTRRLHDLHDNQRQHVWGRGAVRGAMTAVTGSTMVIVGLGNIGRAIARRAVGFEMRVIGVDVRPVEPPPGVEAVWGPDRLDEALGQADVLVIATPLTTETRGMIDARRIGLLKPRSYLLCISRGGIVDEPALIAALQAGRLAGAGLDVQATEPMAPDDPLWDAPNLVLTPHCSGASRQTTKLVWQLTTDNVRRFVTGQPLMNVCDPRAGF